MGDPTITVFFGAIAAYLILTLMSRTGRKQKHQKILQNTAELEHELGWIPHSDPDVLRACQHHQEEDKWNRRSAPNSIE